MAYRLPVANKREIPSRNGKPTARWGRKATGQATGLGAGLPKEGTQGHRNMGEAFR